jgi:predicted HicB family RNase H-like nuclease
MNSKTAKTLKAIFQDPVQSNSMIEYKGYMGTVEYDAEAKLFHGDVLNTHDVITFQGTTAEEVETAFRASIDDYLDWCDKDGMEPESPYSGCFNVRLSPDLHRKIAAAAQKQQMSINSFVEKAVADKVAAVL